jgi:hypothetical protein
MFNDSRSLIRAPVVAAMTTEIVTGTCLAPPAVPVRAAPEGVVETLTASFMLLAQWSETLTAAVVFAPRVVAALAHLRL